MNARDSCPLSGCAPSTDPGPRPRDPSELDSVRQRFVIERFMRSRGSFLDRRARLIKAYGPLLVLVTAGPLLLNAVGAWCLLLTPAAMVIPIAWHEWRLRRTRRRIARGRLCFECAYPLHGAAGDDDGWGRCPECGHHFHQSLYDLDPWRLGRDAGRAPRDTGSAPRSPPPPSTGKNDP